MLVIPVAIVFAIPVVVLTIPVAFMPSPAFTIVVVVWMVPIRPFVGRTLPVPFHPSVMVPVRSPVPLDPDVARARNRPTPLITQGRWRAPDVHGNLCRSRNAESGRKQYSAHPIQFHRSFSQILSFRLRNPLGELPFSAKRERHDVAAIEKTHVGQSPSAVQRAKLATVTLGVAPLSQLGKKSALLLILVARRFTAAVSGWFLLTSFSAASL